MKKYLLDFGYTEEELTELIKEEKIKEIEGDLYIIDPILFADFIICLLSASINPILLFEKDDNYNSIMYHVFKFIDLAMYKEAEMLLQEFIEQHDSFYAKLLYIGLEKNYAKLDETEYILDDTKYESDIVRNNLKKKELELLSAIELEDYKTSYKILMELKGIYDKNQESLPFSVIAEFLMEIRRLSTNHRRVSHHTDFNMTGDFDSVVYGLLKEIDYYRLETFIKDELKSGKKSVKLEIYNLLLDRVIYLNSCNLKYIQDSMKIDVQTKSLSEVMEHPHMPRMTGEFINQLLNPVKEEDTHVNYYKEYEDFYLKKDFVSARESLIKFDKNLKRMNVYKNIDYQLNELDIWINNLKDLDDDSKKILFESYDDAIMLMVQRKYEDAINLLFYLYSLEGINRTKIETLIGRCYYELKNYVLAIEYLSKVKEGYIAPEEIYCLIYSYFKLGEYQKALNLVPKYENYYPDENVKLHYIESICYVKLHEYAEAIDSLESCEAMNVIYYNMPIEYIREKEIINKIKNGKNIPCYTEDDFVSYELNQEERQLRDDINSGLVTVPSIIRMGTVKVHGIKEKIEYLLSCAKVYMQMGKEDEGNEICKFVNNLIDDPRLEKKEKETFTLRLKNYTTI